MDQPNKIDPVRLPEVVVTAKRLDPKKYKSVTPSSKLYPKGDVADSKMDSIKRVNPVLAEKIGAPISAKGYQRVYSPDQSDMIKRVLK